MSTRLKKTAEKNPETEAVEHGLHMKPGFVADYITGIAVRASPEEVEAVQVFSRRLVEDYSYPKDHIQTRPQYRVRKRPSDEAKSYPVDIAVFTGEGRAEDDLFLIVECKKQNRKGCASNLWVKVALPFLWSVI